MDGLFAFQVATTVPLMMRLTSAPRMPMTIVALIVLLLPKVSGMTATLVRPKMTLAVFTTTMRATKTQKPDTSV